MPAILPRRRQVYEFIVAYKRAHDGCAPTIREIMVACGYLTTSAVYYMLKRLQDDGLIEFDLKSSRSIRVVGAAWQPPQESHEALAPSASIL